MKLLLIKAMGASHPYSHFVDALERALADLGHEPVVSDQSIHVKDGLASPAALALLLQDTRYDAIVSFSSFFGAVTLGSETSLYDHLGVKFLGWQLDHPIYATNSLSRALKGRYAIYANTSHLKFAEALKLPGRGVAMLAGGEPLSVPVADFQAREWPVFVAATFNGQPQALWEQAEDSTGKQLLVGVVEELLADPNVSVLDAFNETSRKCGFGVTLGDDPAFDDQMIAFLREPLTYVRNLDRIRIIRSLAESGLPLTLCGPGWRDFLGDRSNVTYLDSRVGFTELQGLYNNSKIVINLNAGNGACERAVYAALAGAAVASDDSWDLAQLLKPTEEIAFFDRSRPGHVVDVARGLVESDGGEAIAERGRGKVLQSGLWRHRAQQMVNFLKA